MNPLIAGLAALIGYLLGSLSFARLTVKLWAPDRDLNDLAVSVVGTEEETPVGIFGANAASMILGPRLGCLVGLLDMLKVALPVLAFRLVYSGRPYFLVTAVAGLIGHNWPIYYRFKGGRGFSVILGSFFVVDWLGALVTLFLGLVTGMVILGNPAAAYVSWLFLMIPWMLVRHHDVAYLLYALAVNILFLIAVLPEIRTMVKYRRQGRLDAYMEGLQTSSPRWRGMKAMTSFAKRFRGRALRVVLVVLGALLVLGLIGPFLVPIPPLDDTVPPEQLADPDSRFIAVNDLQVHYKTTGDGEPTLILLHGFGASVFSWREVMEPLGELGTVIAFDRPAFGLTERPLSWPEGANPYTPEAQVDLVFGLMDALGVHEAILVGNSAGGTVAVNAALAHPERVEGLVLVDAAIYEGGGAPAWIQPLLKAPQLDRLGPLLARQIEVRGDSFLEGAWHDPAKIDPQDRAGYRKPLRADNWDLALWELTKASGAPDLSDRLMEITSPALVISGEEDRTVPVESSIRLADALPNAKLTVIPNCGHVPHEECPGPVLDAMQAFLVDAGDVE